MPAADQVIPVLDAFLDGDVNVTSLDTWCTQKITVQLSGLTIGVLASTSTATTYIQRLFTPPSDLWNVMPPTPQPPASPRRCAVSPCPVPASPLLPSVSVHGAPEHHATYGCTSVPRQHGTRCPAARCS